MGNKTINNLLDIPETAKIDFSNPGFLRKFNIDSEINYRINLTWNGGVARIIEPSGVLKQIKNHLYSILYSQTNAHLLQYDALSDKEKQNLQEVWKKAYDSLPKNVLNFYEQYNSQFKQFDGMRENSRNDETDIRSIRLYSFNLQDSTIPKNLAGTPRTVIDRLERIRLAKKNKSEREMNLFKKRNTRYVEQKDLPGNIENIALGSDNYAEFGERIKRTYEGGLSNELIGFYKSLVLESALALEYHSEGSELPNNLRKIRYSGTHKNNKSLEVILDFDNKFESYAYGDPVEGEIAPVQFNSMSLGFRHKRQMPFDYSECNGELFFERPVVRATSEQNYGLVELIPKASNLFKTYMAPKINQKLSGNLIADSLVLEHSDAIKQMVSKYDKTVKSNF